LAELCGKTGLLLFHVRDYKPIGVSTRGGRALTHPSNTRFSRSRMLENARWA
jgi:hypothetical protein